MTIRLTATQSSERILSLDLIRGIAVLGILLMNISSFSMIGQAYINPTIMGGLEGANKWVHQFNYIFANQKFMSIFSILFGAGIVLFSERVIAKGFSAAKYYYRRLFFLLIFGLIHAYLIWMGDILVAYSLCGAIAFLFRNTRPTIILIVAMLIFSVPPLMNISWFMFVPVEEINESLSWWPMPEAEIANRLSIMRGGFMDIQPVRFEGAVELQTVYFGFHTFWRALSMMLIGMYLYKKYILQARKANSYYTKLAIVGFVVGLAFCYHGVSKAYEHNWDAAHGFVYTEIFNYIGSLFLALSYIALICLWSNSSGGQKLKSLLMKAGKMAFTVYILTSVICTFFFYGYGLGYIGYFDRVAQLLTVIVVWVVLLMFTHFYSQRFGQGPLEKLWRKLTYGQVQ